MGANNTKEDWVRAGRAADITGMAKPTLLRRVKQWEEDRDNNVPEDERRGWAPVTQSGKPLWKPLDPDMPGSQVIWNVEGLREKQRVRR